MSNTEKMYSFVAEPKGPAYKELIKYSLGTCNEFILVVRPTLLLEDDGEVLKQLLPFFIKKLQLQSWPGTTLLKGSAWVYFYKLTPHSAKVLLNSVNSLFDWSQPQLPEDLSLMREDGSPWLVSISHERDSYLYLSEDEFEKLLFDVPLLRELVNI